MSLSLDEVRRIASLARIALSAEEAAGVAEGLNRVLGLIDRMQSVDTRGIEPMAHPLEAETGVVQRRREDAVTEPNRCSELQRGAPRVEQGLYLVPKVLD